MIRVKGELGGKFKKEAVEFNKRDNKRKLSNVGKGAILGGILLPIALPICLAMIGGGVVLNYFTKDELKEYDCILPEDDINSVEFKRKLKK